MSPNSEIKTTTKSVIQIETVKSKHNLWNIYVFLCHKLNRFLDYSRSNSTADVFKGIFFNTLRPRRNEQHFADDIFKRIFFHENVWISIKISLKFVPKGPINNYPALVQIMAWRRSGDKPLSEPMMVNLPTHMCVTRPQHMNLKRTAIALLSNSYQVTITLIFFLQHAYSTSHYFDKS